MARWSRPKRWTDFMTMLQWNGVNNWNIVNDKLLQDNIPLVKEWSAKNIGFVQSEEARTAFKAYFFSDQPSKTSNSYYWKDRAAEALAAVYAKEQACDCRN